MLCLTGPAPPTALALEGRGIRRGAGPAPPTALALEGRGIRRGAGPAPSTALALEGRASGGLPGLRPLQSVPFHNGTWIEIVYKNLL